MKRIKIKSGAELDALTKYGTMSRKYWKRKYNKRFRKATKEPVQ